MTAAVAGLLAAAAARAGVGLSDDLTIGPDRFRSNLAALVFAPSPSFSASAEFGTASAGGPAANATSSGRLEFQTALGQAADASVGVLRFNGFRGLRLSRFVGADGSTEWMASGEAEERQIATEIALGAGAVLFDAGEAAEGEDALRLQRVRLDLGLAAGRLTVPLDLDWGGAAPAAGEARVAHWTVRARLGATVHWTEVGLSFERRHQGDPRVSVDLDSVPLWMRRALRLHPEARRTLESRIRNGVADALSEPAARRVVVTLREPLPGDLALFGAFEYARLLVSGAVARTTTAELSAAAARWLEVRLGSFWVREAGVTDRYTTLGASARF